MAAIQINVEGGHFIEEDISLFDAPFFNMTGDEAAVRLIQTLRSITSLIAPPRPWTLSRGCCLKSHTRDWRMVFLFQTSHHSLTT
jgi:hypothetical protein